MDIRVQQSLRYIPSVETVLAREPFEALAQRYGRSTVTDAIRQAAQQIRQEILQGAFYENPAQTSQEVIRRAIGLIQQLTRPFYCRAINATGIILHTGLGRAVLAKAAMDQIQQELAGYSVLQVDRQTGKRSRRDEGIERLLQRLTGAEAATVVNNNAAATAIVLNTIANGREVIVSRGQLVEIGGSFRLPQVMAFSCARLVEVGTTNRTHAKDYEQAINPNTAAILRVHPSNYRVRGFTAEVPLGQLVQIAHRHNLILVDDLGAGALVDLGRFGLEPEPTIADSIRAGADIVTCSGDKLIGGPQAGLVLGRKELIEAVRKNQFFRIVRVCKLTLAALEATLKLFLDEQTALSQIPAYRMLTMDQQRIKDRAESILSGLTQRALPVSISLMPGWSQMGSGSLPTEQIPTTLVAIRPAEISTDELAMRLRMQDPPVFTRIQDDLVLIDPRTLLDGQTELVIEAVCRALMPDRPDGSRTA